MRDVRVGVVGAGYWGPNVIRTFRSLPGCEVAYACDRRPGRLAYLSGQFPDLRTTDRYEDLLEDPDLDAVAIVTPPTTHRALAAAAIRAGKHVFVEKPLAASVEDAAYLVDAADRARRVLATGHVFVHHPAVRHLRDLIRGGEIGRLCYAQSDRVNLGPPATEVDVIWDLAIHDVAVLLSLADADPVDVQADGSRYAHPRLTDVAFLTLRFGNGFLAKVHVSWLSPSKVRRMFVAGSQGSAVFDDMHPTEKLVLTDLGVDSRVGADDRAAHELFYRPGERRVCPVPDALPLSEECAQFLDCVRFGGRPDADGHAGLAVVRVLDAAQRSLSEGGRSIRLDGRFVPLASAS